MRKTSSSSTPALSHCSGVTALVTLAGYRKASVQGGQKRPHRLSSRTDLSKQHTQPSHNPQATTPSNHGRCHRHSRIDTSTRIRRAAAAALVLLHADTLAIPDVCSLLATSNSTATTVRQHYANKLHVLFQPTRLAQCWQFEDWLCRNKNGRLLRHLEFKPCMPWSAPSYRDDDNVPPSLRWKRAEQARETIAAGGSASDTEW